MSVTALLDSAKDAFYALAGSCCKPDATLKLNGRSFKILKLLGEGGFSYVYLAQDQASGRLFALKKIRCPLGSDSVKAALKEVEAYKRFRHPNIIRCLDSCVVQDREADGKVIYLFLPYYKNGTVQHIISANFINGSRYPEAQMLSIFHGTCLAVRAMHQHRSGPSASPSPSSSTAALSFSSRDKRAPKMNYPPRGGIRSTGEMTTEEDFDPDDDEEEQPGGLRSGGEGQALIGGLEGAHARLEEEGEGVEGMGDEDGATVLGRVGDGKDETGGRLEEGGAQQGGITPWAHRDIKPANIMLSDDGSTPILMDFGSALPARIPIPDRRVALLQQDLAAEHCSMPFRAPELFDVRRLLPIFTRPFGLASVPRSQKGPPTNAHSQVKTGTTLTESVDIWSLGCTLFAMAYGTSPFETAQQSEHGGSVAMAVLGGKFRFPEDGGAYSEGFRELVRCMLKVKAEERPGIQQVIDMTEQALARLQ